MITPGVLGTGEASRISQAPDCNAQRVYILADGPPGSTLFVGFDASALQATTNNFCSNGFAIPAGADVTFVVGAGQTLYAIASATGVTLSAAISDLLSTEGY